MLWFKSLWAFFQSHCSRGSGLHWYLFIFYSNITNCMRGRVASYISVWPRTIACNCRSIQSVMRDINLTILPQPLYFWENEMEPILARPFLILTVRKRIYLCALFCVIYNLSLQACYNRKSIFRHFKILLSMCKRLSVYHKCLSYIQIIITINHILYEYICLDNSMKRIRHEGHIDLWSRFSLSIGNILLKHDAEITFT